MRKPSKIALSAAGVLFLLFFGNVTVGALGQKAPLGDIQEMLMLFAASITFVVSVLLSEAERDRAADDATEET